MFISNIIYCFILFFIALSILILIRTNSIWSFLTKYLYCLLVIFILMFHEKFLPNYFVKIKCIDYFSLNEQSICSSEEIYRPYFDGKISYQLYKVKKYKPFLQRSEIR